MKAISIRRSRRLTLLAVLLSCLLACPAAAAPGTAARISDQPVPLASGAGVLVPSSPGTIQFTGSGATLDASNASEGYVTARYSGKSSRAKVQITRDGGATYTYNLRNDGRYEVFPLTDGDGSYQVAVYYNVHDSQYALCLSEKLDVRLRDPMLPYLYPSQFVNFSAGSQAVTKAGELSQAASDDLAVISNIYNYVIGNISYDNARAQQVIDGKLSGYVPDVDSVLASGKGICFDYAALMAAMLRSRQIPTRMEVGYAGSAYHAWISTYVSDVGWVNGVIQFDGKDWTLMDPTFAASGGANSQFTGGGVSYQPLKRY